MTLSKQLLCASHCCCCFTHSESSSPFNTHEEGTIATPILQTREHEQEQTVLEADDSVGLHRADGRGVQPACLGGTEVFRDKSGKEGGQDKNSQERVSICAITVLPVI